MAACPNCGRELSPRAAACPQCGEPGPAAVAAGAGAGYPPPPPPPPAPAHQPGSVGSVIAAMPRTEPFAIASIVCAVANFFGAFVIGAVLAIVFGKVAQKNIARNPALEGANLARMGIIVGWVGVGLVVAFVVLAVGVLGIFSASTGDFVPVVPD
jgi:Domain of unknown function (DUF4190)